MRRDLDRPLIAASPALEVTGWKQSSRDLGLEIETRVIPATTAMPSIVRDVQFQRDQPV